LAVVVGRIPDEMLIIPILRRGGRKSFNNFV